MKKKLRRGLRSGGVFELHGESGAQAAEGPQLGGPRKGRFGRVRTREGGSRIFGGPLGRPADRAKGEQGRLWGWLQAGLSATRPAAVAGESTAGRGSAGLLRRFRDLGRYGLGGDARGRRRYLEERGPEGKGREWE